VPPPGPRQARSVLCALPGQIEFSYVSPVPLPIGGLASRRDTRGRCGRPSVSERPPLGPPRTALPSRHTAGALGNWPAQGARVWAKGLPAERDS